MVQKYYNTYILLVFYSCGALSVRFEISVDTAMVSITTHEPPKNNRI